jgi:putative ABC transport system permease protein
MTRFFRRLRARIRYRNFNDELTRELDVHRAMVEDDVRAQGVAPDDARYRATRRLGNLTLAREEARSVWIAPWLESVWQDVRYGARSLWHSPGFTTTALLTLVLGIGLNTMLFSAVNSLLLQPWHAPDAQQLVLAYHRTSRGLIGGSAPELAFLQQHATSVDLAGTRPVGGTLAQGTATRSASGRLVTVNYFTVLKVPIVLGRGLQRDDDLAGRMPVMVLGHEVWRAFFSADREIVGRTIRFRDQEVTVVGVAGPGVRESVLTGPPELWLPLSSMPTLFPDEPFAREFITNAGHCCVGMVGRLRPGRSRADVEAELSTLDRQFRDAVGRNGLGMRVTGTETGYHPEAAKAVPIFALLMVAVALVLLLTCANVGNLQLARTAARQREVTIRLALGAARWRIVRQLLTEGLLLSVIATSLCLVASSLVARAMMLRIDPSLAKDLDFTIDGRVLLFATLLALVACLVTSFAPALRGTRRLVAGYGSDRPSVRLRSTFLAAQVAISVVLLVAAALLARGLTHAASGDVGFRLETLMALDVERASTGPDSDRVIFHDVMTAVDRRHVAATMAVPLGDYSLRSEVRRAGEPYEANREVRFHPVSSNYFDVLGISLRSGRAFSEGAPNEVVLNETLARMLWPDGDAVGGFLAGPGGTIGRQVVGIAADAQINDLGDVGPSIFQAADSLKHLLFNKGAVAPDELRALVISADPKAKITLRAVADNVGRSLQVATLGARIAGGIGLLALAVAAVGIAGVFSFAVTERTRELGIHLALGASGARVRALVLRRTSLPLVIGTTVGLPLAFAVGVGLRRYLYGLSPADPIAYAAVIGGVVLTAWMATLVPMRRALRVDPAVTLRHE